MAVQTELAPGVSNDNNNNQNNSNNMAKRRGSNGSMLVVNTTIRSSTRLDPLSRMTLRRMTQIKTDQNAGAVAKKTLEKMKSDTFMSSTMNDPLVNTNDIADGNDVDDSFTPSLPPNSTSFQQYTSFDGYGSLKSTSDADEALSKWLEQVQKADIEYHKKMLHQKPDHQDNNQYPQEDPTGSSACEEEPVKIDVTKYSFHRKSRAYTLDSRRSTRIKRGMSTPSQVLLRRNTSRESPPLCHGHALHLHFRTSDGQMMQVARTQKKQRLPRFAANLFSRRIRCFGVPEEYATESTRQSTDSNPEQDETLRVVAHSPDGMVRGGDVISFARRDGFVLRIQNLSKKLCFNRKLDAKAKFIIAGVSDGTIVTESTKFYLQSVYDRSKIVGFARDKKPGHIGCLELYNAGIKDDKCEPIQFFEKFSRYDEQFVTNMLQPLEEALEGFLPTTTTTRSSSRTESSFFSRLVTSLNNL